MHENLASWYLKFSNFETARFIFGTEVGVQLEVVSLPFSKSILLHRAEISV